MKIKIIKTHHEYPLGEVNVDEDRARYLIAVGVAEEYREKSESPSAMEKKENKTGNVPTAKKRKK